MAVHGHPRSFWHNQKGGCVFLLVINSKLGPNLGLVLSCTISETQQLIG